MSPNPNELSALNLLGHELNRTIEPWSGKPAVRNAMRQQPGIRMPDRHVHNDSRSEDIDDAFACWKHKSPDGYFIEPHSEAPVLGWAPGMHHLCLVEVETTSRMTESKLRAYAHAWDIFEGSDAWGFHVIVYDWYDQWRELNLMRLFYRWVSSVQPNKDERDIEVAKWFGEMAQQLQAGKGLESDG